MSKLNSRRTQRIKHLPLVLHWKEPDRPLPLRVIRSARPRKKLSVVLNGSPVLKTGDAGRAFNFCDRIQRLCADIVTRCEELQHIDLKRLLFGVIQARNGHAHGLQARVTPLRFPGGKRTLCRRGIIYQVQRFLLGEVEFLYLITFCLPRFLDQDFDNKLITLFHELYHISPAFDGDLRRHKGRYALHTHSQRQYDEHMAKLAREYVTGHPKPALFDFLRLNFAQLESRHGQILGVSVPRPKIIPVGTRSSH